MWAFNLKFEDFLQILNADERDMHAQDRDGMTPLHIASMFGHLDMVEELVKRGSWLLFKTWDGRTALDCASQNSLARIVACLESASLRMDSSTVDWTDAKDRIL